MKGNLFFTLALAAVSAGQAAADNTVFAYKAGPFDVWVMVEREGERKNDVLIGVPADIIQKIAPSGASPSGYNTVLARGLGHTILFDTGFGSALFDNMKKIGVSPADVDAVMITHLHGDHFGGMQKDGKPNFPNATVYLAEKEKEFYTVTSPNEGAAAALKAYGNRVKTFSPGGIADFEAGKLAALLPGVYPIEAYGHTPGHVCFLLAGPGVKDAEKLLIGGDLVHAEAIQFPYPQYAVSYDTDKDAAIAARKELFAWCAARGVPLTGMHLAYPAMGTLQKSGAGYSFTHK